MGKIATIISFCTNDVRFLRKCIEAVKPFSKQILIPVCDHFYNGELENLALLETLFKMYPDIDFIEFAYSEKEIYGTPVNLFPASPGWAQHWHNSARLVGYYFLEPEVEWVLFCDVDEIFERWCKAFLFEDYVALRFATYWYFQKSTQCATTFPDGPLLVKREKITHQLLLDENERMGLFFKISGKKEREVLFEGKPLVHHYSWVRTKEEMLKKAKTWGHHWERDWEKLIEKSTCKDFVRNYTYQQTRSFWDPLQEKIEIPEEKTTLEAHLANLHHFPNVQRVTVRDIYRREIVKMSKEDVCWPR